MPQSGIEEKFRGDKPFVLLTHKHVSCGTWIIPACQLEFFCPEKVCFFSVMTIKLKKQCWLLGSPLITKKYESRQIVLVIFNWQLKETILKTFQTNVNCAMGKGENGKGKEQCTTSIRSFRCSQHLVRRLFFYVIFNFSSVLLQLFFCVTSTFLLCYLQLFFCVTSTFLLCHLQLFFNVIFNLMSDCRRAGFACISSSSHAHNFFLSKCISESVFLKMYFPKCISQNVFLKVNFSKCISQNVWLQKSGFCLHQFYFSRSSFFLSKYFSQNVFLKMYFSKCISQSVFL